MRRSVKIHDREGSDREGLWKIIKKVRRFASLLRDAVPVSQLVCNCQFVVFRPAWRPSSSTPPRAKGKARAVEEPEEEWRNLAGGEAEAGSPPITAQMPSNERRRVLCPGPVPHRRLHSFAGGEAEAGSPPITAQMPSNERRRVLCPGPVPHRRLHSCQLPPS